VSEGTRILTAWWGEPETVWITRYVQTGGYKGLRKALKMTPKEVIDEVKVSGLRGRGGAGFPTGVKWSFVPQDTGKPTYLVANFDESEPGTYNNRELVERDPHQFLEGVIIASYAVQCHTAFIYNRGEFLFPGQVLERAVAEAYEEGFLGRNILKSGSQLDVVLHKGAGAYICGEETALLSSLEGFRGQPRLRPPFPAVEGLYASPTAINNV
jgi:NADH-quinone oxidoreductase subunit F